MRFGLFHNLHDLTKQRDYAALLDELRDLAAICDETDYDVFWMPEHHFSIWGRELLPNPLMVAVDLAARTNASGLAWPRRLSPSGIRSAPPRTLPCWIS